MARTPPSATPAQYASFWAYSRLTLHCSLFARNTLRNTQRSAERRFGGVGERRWPWPSTCSRAQVKRTCPCAHCICTKHLRCALLERSARVSLALKLFYVKARISLCTATAKVIAQNSLVLINIFTCSHLQARQLLAC